MDEAALIASIQSHGNRNAFAFLVRRYQSPLRSYLFQLCHHQRELADDIAQEAFLKAFKNIDQFRGTAKFSTWLFQIARNLYLDIIKRPGFSTSDGETFVSSQIDLNLDLHRALQKLPTAEKEVLLLSYVEELTHEEIAMITQTPVGTVKSRILQAKEKVKIFFKESNHETTHA